MTFENSLSFRLAILYSRLECSLCYLCSLWQKKRLWFGAVIVRFVFPVVSGLAMMGAVAALEAVDPAVLEKCRANPALLRQRDVYERFQRSRPESCQEWAALVAADPGQPPDVRARALLLCPFETSSTAYMAFRRDFDPMAEAGTVEGAAALNFLSGEVFGQDARAGYVREMLLPGPDLAGVGAILTALAGRPCHDYLYMLHGQKYAFTGAQVQALARTDDEPTRRFLYWYAGQKLKGQASFLAGEVLSPRPSDYGGRGMRLLLFTLTGAMSELVRAVLPPPEWLAEDRTTRDLALEALDRQLTAGQPIPDPAIAARLLPAAVVFCGRPAEPDYRLGAELLIFLKARQVTLGADGRRAVALLARKPLDHDARNDAFVLAERVHRRTGVPLPAFSERDQNLLWDRALHTLNPAYLGAAVRALPDGLGAEALRRHLLKLGPEAASGQLRFPSQNEGWFAMHDPGDWCLCAGELKLEETLPFVSRALEGSWSGKAMRALIKFGAAGLPEARRFLLEGRVQSLDGATRRAAVRFCAGQLADPERDDFLKRAMANEYLRPFARELSPSSGK